MSHSVVAWDRWYMGGASLSAGAGWPERLWGSQQRSGLVLGDAGPPRITFTGASPTTPSVSLAVLRVREERPLAVLHGPGLDPGQETSRPASSTGTRSTRYKGWAMGGAAGTSTSTGSRPAATTPPATTSARRAMPSRRSSSARCTTRTSYLRAAHLVRELPLAVGQRRVQDQPEAHGESRDAPGLPDRPHRGERRVLDVRSEHS